MTHKSNLFDIAIKEKYVFIYDNKNLNLKDVFELDIIDLLKMIENIKITIKILLNYFKIDNKSKIIEILDIQSCIVEEILGIKLSKIKNLNEIIY